MCTRTWSRLTDIASYDTLYCVIFEFALIDLYKYGVIRIFGWENWTDNSNTNKRYSVYNFNTVGLPGLIRDESRIWEVIIVKETSNNER